MARYRVFMERVEHYSYQVEVEAKTAADAERKAQTMDEHNEFEDEWNELQPEVETMYEAEEIK